MANPKEWGPVLWKIIHYSMEHLGNQTNKLLQNDEIHAYKKFVIQIKYILPCKICKIHYSKHLLHHKKEIVYSELKSYAKRFFYTIHDEVNKEKDVISIEYDMLETLYGTMTKSEFHSCLKEFESLFQKYKLYHYVEIEAVRDFLKALQLLMCF